MEHDYHGWGEIIADEIKCMIINTTTIKIQSIIIIKLDKTENTFNCWYHHTIIASIIHDQEGAKGYIKLNSYVHVGN